MQRLQRNLVAGLFAEIDQAYTFSRIAMHRLQRGDDKRCVRSLDSARTKLEVVRQLVGDVQDSCLRRRVRDLTEEADRVIASLLTQTSRKISL